MHYIKPACQKRYIKPACQIVKHNLLLQNCGTNHEVSVRQRGQKEAVRGKGHAADPPPIWAETEERVEPPVVVNVHLAIV